MAQRVRIAVIVMGFSGLIAEIILLRELLIVFSGNELSIGIILANWLMLEAIGCFYPGRLIDRTEKKTEAFALATILFSIALIAAVCLIRPLKATLGVSLGEHIGLFPMFYSSLLILLPVSLLHGALFTFSCRIYTLHRPPDATIAGKVYVDETIGTMAGGILCTFIFIPFLNSFEVIIGVALLNMVACLRIIPPATQKELRYRTVPIGLAILAIVFAATLFTGRAEHLHQATLQKQWKEHQVVHYQNSPYSNITVIENQGQHLFFLDGIAEIITPIPDMLFVEEFVHLPMLSHPDPQEIFILRSGAGGVIDEVLKHPSVQNIAYAEHDPVFLEVIRQFPDSLTRSELNDPAVQVHYRDGRLMLATSSEKYDVIFIGVKEPSNLQSNRFFTQEFFTLIQERLKEGGILAFAAPGSLTFLSDELKNLNSTLYHTAGSVFSHVRVIPGEHHNLYLVSDDDAVARLDMARMVQRLEERRIRTEGVVPWHIEKKLHEGWRQWFLDYIEDASHAINRDFKPVALYYHITHWNAIYAPVFGLLYRQFEHIGPGSFIPWLLLFAGIVIVARSRSRRAKRFAVPFSIFTTGFAGMIFSLIIIFMFQVTFGNIFSWIGLLIAFFMAGAAIGAMLATRFMPRSGQERRWFLIIEWAVAAFALLLLLLFPIIHPMLDSSLAFALFRILFLALSLMAGILTGLPFPLANKLHLRDDTGVSRTGGMLYASDLLGGWLGGLAGGVVLLPVMGVTGTCLTVALFKFTSYIITVSQPKG